jgi:hypothetical protein
VIGALKTFGVLTLIGADPVGVGVIVVSVALLAFGLLRGGKKSPPPPREASAPPSAEEEWAPPRNTAPREGGLTKAMRTRREQLSPPAVARGPENQPSPASSEEIKRQVVEKRAATLSRKDSLREEREQGAKLLAALRDPSGSLRVYGRGVNWQEADSWEANLRTLLKGDEVKVFDYQPLREQPAQSLLQVLAKSLGNDAAIERMERRLLQLDKIIQR